MKKKLIEPDKLIYRLRDVRRAFPRLNAIERGMPEFVADLEDAQSRARKFGVKHIAPVALDIDARIERDHSYFPWDIVRAALPYRFLSMIVPKPFGGVGGLTSQMAVTMEELCSFCPGVANIFGAHALGLSPILMEPDIRLYEKYMRPVAEGEKRGEPLLFALAITEPAAGSDLEDAEFIRTSRLCTTARKVKGGYIINGRKVFISNGNIARFIWVGAVMDKSRPGETSCSFIVPNDAPGFSVGSVEKKMGQRACPAAELVFEDVFAPEEDMVGGVGEGERLTDIVLGGSRAPVAAIAVGTARGAFERLLAYVGETRVRGKRLFEYQWVQLELADMMTKIQAARQLYLDASLFVDLEGIPKLMSRPEMKLLDMMPRELLKLKLVSESFKSKQAYRAVRAMADRLVSPEDISLGAAYSSMAKFSAGDLAVEICSRAMDVMGPDGPVREFGVEKALRDAKLTQIYEGTNQINRIYTFRKLLA